MINNMKKFDIDVDINGRITFEVEARNKNEAKAKVDELLRSEEHTSELQSR